MSQLVLGSSGEAASSDAAESNLAPVDDACVQEAGPQLTPSVPPEVNSVQALGPSRSDTVEDGVCGKCGRAYVVGSRFRCQCGATLRKNPFSSTTSIYSDVLLPGLASLPAEIDRFMAGALADEGDNDVPTRRRSLIEYRGQIVHRNILKLAFALEARGLTDKRGRLRTIWLQQLGALIDKAIRLDMLLGLSRRAKPVPTLSDWLAARIEHEGTTAVVAHPDQKTNGDAVQRSATTAEPGV